MKLLLTYLFLFSTLTVAEANTNTSTNTEPYIDGTKITIESSSFNETRSFFVRVPESYHTGAINLPVIYTLDGRGYFDSTKAIVAKLGNAHMMPDSIVVAIENKNRYKDLRRPGSIKLINFIKNEVIPYINKNYRTSSYTILAGNSLGGTFVIETLIKEQDLFNAYIAISPVIGFEKTLPLVDLENFFKLNSKLDGYLYFAMGNEKNPYDKTIPEFEEILKQHAAKTFRWEYQQFPDENHVAVSIPGYYFGLRKLFDGWMLPNHNNPSTLNSEDHIDRLGGVSGILSYYKDYNQKTGYPVKIPTIVFSRIMWILQKANKDEKLMSLMKAHGKDYPLLAYYLTGALLSTDKEHLALIIANDMIKHHPELANSWESFARVQKNSMNYPKAKKAFEKAQEIAIKNNNPNIQQYTNNLNEINNLMNNKLKY